MEVFTPHKLVNFSDVYFLSILQLVTVCNQPSICSVLCIHTPVVYCHMTSDVSMTAVTGI